LPLYLVLGRVAKQSTAFLLLPVKPERKRDHPPVGGRITSALGFFAPRIGWPRTKPMRPGAAEKAVLRQDNITCLPQTLLLSFLLSLDVDAVIPLRRRRRILRSTPQTTASLIQRAFVTVLRKIKYISRKSKSIDLLFNINSEETFSR
jgi:hypothetical protein